MLHAIPLYIGLRYARSGTAGHFIGFINTFSVAGIALGLAALMLVTSVMNGFEGQLKERVLGIVPQLLVANASQHSAVKLASIDGVNKVENYIESEGVIQSAQGLKGVIIQGVEQVDHNSPVGQHILQGSSAYLVAGEYGLIIGRALAQQLGARLGEQVRVISTQASIYGPMGRVPSQRLFRVVAIYDVGSEMDDKVVLMHKQDAARLLRKKPTQISQWRLTLDDAFNYQQVQQQLQHMGIDSVSWRNRQGPLFDAVKMEKNMMSLMLLLIIAVAAFNIVSALVMLVSEKQGDIAILRTQGLNRQQLFGIFMVNGLYNGFKGALIGLLLGGLLVWQINNLLYVLGVPLALADDGAGLPVDVQYGQVAVMALLSIVLCFLATLYPAYRASRVEPAQALKYE